MPSVSEQQGIIENLNNEVNTDDNLEIDTQPKEINVDEVITEDVEAVKNQEPVYAVGDIFQIDDKPWRIEKLDDDGGFVHLKKLGEPSIIAAFDSISIQSGDFNELL